MKPASDKAAVEPGLGAPPAEKRTGRIVSIDWCEASVKFVTVDNLCALLARHFGPQFGRNRLEVLREDESYFDAKGPLGMRVRADKVGQANRAGQLQTWAGVRLPGDVCEVVGTEAVLDLAESMQLAGPAKDSLKVSRMDGAMDDFDKTFSPRQFAEFCVAGRLDDENALLGPGVVTRVRRDNHDWSRRRGGCFWIGGGKSARLLRVYDKDKESKGRIPATRIELQSRDRFATAFVERLLEARWTGRPMAEVFAEHLVSFVDLRQPEGHRSSSQTWKRVGFWEQVIGDVKGVATRAADDSTVGEWMGEMQKLAGGFLGVLLRAEGLRPQDLRRALTDAEVAKRVVRAVLAAIGGSMKRLSAEHDVRLEQLVRQREAWGKLHERVGKSRP